MNCNRTAFAPLSETRSWTHTSGTRLHPASLILPLFTILGYDYTDPRECIPEFKADFGKGRSVKPADWAFYQNGPVWTDSTAQAQKDMKQQQVAFNSDAYFALLRKYPNAAAWFSLGD